MMPDNRPRKKDFDLLHQLTENFNIPSEIPCSFYYGSRKIQGIPWKFKYASHRIDANLTHTIIEAKDPDTKLEIKVVYEQYQDFPVLEWTVYLKNKGTESTPVIHELLGMDMILKLQGAVLQHCNGDAVGNESFEFCNTVLTEDVFEMQPVLGRCCDAAFPYMRLLSQTEEKGIILSVGWPGQWKTQFSTTKDGVMVKAGQAETCFYLKPGECVRTPRMTILAFQGNERRAVNLWRRWYLSHVMPKINGEIAEPMLIVHADQPSAEYPEHTSYTQDMIERALDNYQKHGVKFNAFWLDAGWYDCGTFWPKVGTWEERQPNYPEGMLGVKQVCEAHGAKLILWFEPERVYDGTKIAVEHPEWLLDCQMEIKEQQTRYAPKSRLFNMGNPEARDYITDLIAGFIHKNKIDWYRQDYNIHPLAYWRANDEENRKGITENFYIQGYLEFWDKILERNPWVRIDSCASGGRRNDMETMRRAVPLHYSDLAYGNQPVKMGFEQTMHDWIPYFKSHLWSWENPDGSYKQDENYQPNTLSDTYAFYTELAPAVTLMTPYDRDDSEFEAVRLMQNSWKRAADLMLCSDFYPLTEYHKNPEKWWCRQFDSSDKKEGFLLFVTGNQCKELEQTVYPYVDEEVLYLFENEQTGEKRKMTGKEVALGFKENLSTRSGSIWFYKKLKI